MKTTGLLLVAGVACLLAAPSGAAASTPRGAATLPEAPAREREPQVRITVPAGGTVHYEWNEAGDGLVVDRFLTMPVAYPAHLGHLPEARDANGLPLEVLVYTHAPVLPGAALRVRPIGVLRMSDRGVPRDKLIAVPATGVDPRFDNVRDVTDLSLMERRRLEAFFVVYKLLPDGRNPVELGPMEGAGAAQHLLEESLLRGVMDVAGTKK